MEQWNGKKWYCYGTSMTDNRYIDSVIGTKLDGTSNTGITGYYTEKLAEMSGLIEYNFGKAGSGIIPSLHGDDNIKSRCMRMTDGKIEADLITVEVIPNDIHLGGKLGSVDDVSDDTFCGNLNQILKYLLENTKAYVVVLSASRGRYLYDDMSAKFLPTSQFVKKYMEWEDAVDTICRMHGIQYWDGAGRSGLGYYRVENGNVFLQDQAHLTEKGGEILAKYYWGKLKNIYPI